MTATMHVSQLSMTPVKGLALHYPDHLDLTRGGVVNDRAFFLIDEKNEMVSCVKFGALMQHSADYDAAAGTLTVSGPEGVLRTGSVELGEPTGTDFYGERQVDGHVVMGWTELFSDIVGRQARLVMGTTGGFDIAPVTLMGTATAEALGHHSGSDGVDVRRFRMSLYVTGSEPLEEDTWEGRSLRVGDTVVLRVGEQVPRCAATTRNPDTGAVDLQTLKMIGDYKGRTKAEDGGYDFFLGVYAEVTAEGRVHLDDKVELI